MIYQVESRTKYQVYRVSLSSLYGVLYRFLVDVPSNFVCQSHRPFHGKTRCQRDPPDNRGKTDARF